MTVPSSSELWAWREIQMHTGFEIERMPFTLVYSRRCESQAFLKGYQKGQQDTRRELLGASKYGYVRKDLHTPCTDHRVHQGEPIRKRLRTKQKVTNE